MQAQRNKILAISLLVLVAASTTLLYVGRVTEKPVDKELFKVTDLKRIDMVVLQSRADTVELSFSGSRWLVNKAEPADRDLIDVLFATLLQAEPRRPVSESRQDSILLNLNSTGVRVSLFAAGEMQKQFVAGGNHEKTQGYYGMDGRAYVVNIPGYKVYVPGIFELKEQEWFDKFVFALNWTNFKKLEVTFPAQRSDNFDVILSNSFFEVAGIPTDTTRLNEFLEAVSFLTVDQYFLPDTLPVIKQQITITDLANRAYAIGVSNIQAEGKTACQVHGKHWAWVDNRKLARLVRPRNFYGKKP